MVIIGLQSIGVYTSEKLDRVLVQIHYIGGKGMFVRMFVNEPRVAVIHLETDMAMCNISLREISVGSAFGDRSQSGWFW